MGVPGLWDIVNVVGRPRALAHLSVAEGFEGNKSGKRAYRVGIDASIWYHHASFSKGGENPEIRTIFFRLRSLAELPIIPVFLFDGRERPKVKRGSKMGKSGSHGLTQDMKELLEAFGMEWRMALGEAEAELACLNQKGHIDAILTDDCDVLIFGGRTIIKNSSLALSGNKSNPPLNSEGKPSKHHVMIYTAEAVRTHPKVSLTRGGLILFALLAGGDYDKGVEKIGKVIAHALARSGFGDELLRAYEARQTCNFETFLTQWRASVNHELEFNPEKRLPHRCSVKIPESFPNLQVLENYVNPISSGQAGTGGGGALRDKGDLNLGLLAAFCEQKFEWGYKSGIIRRFRDLMWHAAVAHVLRRAALEADEKERTKRLESGNRDHSIRGPLKPSKVEGVGTPTSVVKHYLTAARTGTQDRYSEAFINRGTQSQPRWHENIPDTHPLITKIVGTRTHVSTDKLLEYRAEISPLQLIEYTSAGIKGTRPEPPSSANMEDGISDDEDEATKKNPKKPPPPPESIMRIWIPASILHQVHPGLVEDFVMAEEAKKNKSTKGKGKSRAIDEDEGNNKVPASSPARAPHHAAARKAPRVANTHVNAPLDANVAHQSVVLDPWFTGNEATGSPKRFLFTFPDPDYPYTSEDQPDIQADAGIPPMADEDYAMLPAGCEPNDDLPEDDLPRTRFDALCDQILDGKVRRSRAPTTTKSRKRAKDLVSKLDTFEAGVRRRAEKRQKVSHDASNDTYVPPQSQPFPFLPDLSDSDDLPLNPSQSWKSVRASTSERRATIQPRFYPEPSSSQDSRLSYGPSEDFLDLTI